MSVVCSSLSLEIKEVTEDTSVLSKWLQEAMNPSQEKLEMGSFCLFQMKTLRMNVASPINYSTISIK